MKKVQKAPTGLEVFNMMNTVRRIRTDLAEISERTGVDFTSEAERIEARLTKSFSNLFGGEAVVAPQTTTIRSRRSPVKRKEFSVERETTESSRRGPLTKRSTPVDVNSLGGRIRVMREGNAMTQAELARRLKVDQSRISTYERNVAQVPSEVLTTLSTVFSKPVSFFTEASR